MSTEAFPSFTATARKRWEAIPAEARKRLLSNVWCGECRKEFTITNFCGSLRVGDLVLLGRCAECKGEVSRLIEAS